MRHPLVPAALAVIALAVVLAGWMIVSPGWAVGLLAQQAEQQLGRRLEVKGSTAIEFSPRLAIRLDDASLANPGDMDGSFITAKSIRIPVRFADLLTRAPDLSALELDGAEVALLVNERNETSWGFAAVKSPSALRLTLADSALRFYDARSAQAFALSGLQMAIDIGPEGDVTAKGTADMGGRLARIDAYLKSLARVENDGSPLDLTIEAPDGTASFSGRLSTSGLLGLAGPVTLTSPDLRAAARWAGVAVDASQSALPLSVTGGLESAGRAFAIRRATINLGAAQGQGDVALDLRATTPKVQAALSLPALALDPFLPASGRQPGQWGTAPLDLHLLKAFDADLTLDATAFTSGQTTVGPGRLTVAAAGGRLKAALSIPVLGKGSLSLETGLDASALPPAFSLSLRGQNADIQSYLPLVIDAPWLAGHGALSLTLSGSGRTEQEIVGTLAGSASLSLADGTIAGIDIGAVLGEVSQRIVTGWREDGGTAATPFTIAGGEATLADGIATIRSARIEAEGLSVSATGSVDLLRRAVDLSASPRVLDAAGKASGLPVPVIVRGPWDKPRIYPDLPDVLAKPKEAYDRLKAMGLPPAN